MSDMERMLLVTVAAHITRSLVKDRMVSEIGSIEDNVTGMSITQLLELMNRVCDESGLSRVYTDATQEQMRNPR